MVHSRSLPFFGRSMNLTVLGVSRILLVVQLLLFVSSESSLAMKDKGFNKFGTVKKAWPEYQGGNATEVQKELEEQGVTVFVESPRDGSPPISAGKDQDVWLYTDGHNHVLGIPVRGIWHPNRLQPGWPELVGTPYMKAANIITAEQIGVRVVYGPNGFPRVKDFNVRRVWLDVDPSGNVAVTPKLG